MRDKRTPKDVCGEANRDAMTKNIKTQILYKSYEKTIQKEKQKTSEIASEETKIWYKFPSQN